VTVLGGVVVVALLVVLGIGGFIVFRGNGSGSSGAQANGDSAPAKHDISSQQVDPKPLSVAEVFPAATIAPNPALAAYQVVKPQLSADCGVAAVGTLATMLTNQGCTQVVRATLRSADQAYVITAGIFNLRDKAATSQASSSIKATVDGQQGRFTGYDVGGSTSVIAHTATQLGWDVQGHFLVYAVVAQANGKPIAGADPTAQKIINDMVEVYLKGTVIESRISPKPSPTPSAASTGK
jgi:hypothetical protein